ncbi:MAG TPA: hypothetical protein VM680_00120 [Verrucomicrobiae bacterium]|nr:hypothetical protein [Verrucomicrobiae bacterium]
MPKSKARTAIGVTVVVLASLIAFMLANVDVRNPANVSKAKIKYVQVSLVEHIQETGRVPKELREVPAIASQPTFLRDGWGGEIKYSVDDSERITLRADGPKDIVSVTFSGRRVNDTNAARPK